MLYPLSYGRMLCVIRIPVTKLLCCFDAMTVCTSYLAFSNLSFYSRPVKIAYHMSDVFKLLTSHMVKF